MEEVVLVVHLILALAIIILVLLQRSEGGGLGIGGSGGLGGFASARGTANALTRATTFLAIGFFATSLTLGVLANMETSSAGLLDRIGEEAVVTQGEEDAAMVEAVAPVSDVTDAVVAEDASEEVREAEEGVSEIVEKAQEDVKEEVEAAPVAPVSE